MSEVPHAASQIKALAPTPLNGEDSANWQPYTASTPERLLCPRPGAGAVPPYPVLISRVGCRSWARSSWVLASCCMRRKCRAAPISSTVIMAGCLSSRVVTWGTNTAQGCPGQGMSCTWGKSEGLECPQHRSTPSLHMIHSHPTGAA